MSGTLRPAQVRIPRSQRQKILSLISEFQKLPPTGYEYQAGEMLKKFIDNRSPDAALRAVQKWLEMDDRLGDCYVAFKRKYASSHSFGLIIDHAAELIRRILGPFQVQELVTSSRFGPGASMSVRGLDTNPYRKFNSSEVTSDFRSMAANLITLNPPWCTYLSGSATAVPLLKVTNVGELRTVLKTSEVDRPIVIEPAINTYYQLGVGKMIRRRVERFFRCDLSDQSLNRSLARYGSVTNSLCTIDLSSASDSISHWLVRRLLPDDWFYWCEILRTKWVSLPGVETPVFPRKFSSMGNGFTWDLESLIFYALTWSCAEFHRYNTFWIAVFGDDIVAPSGMYRELRDTLEGCGFILNEGKSFVNSCFRESCGHDYVKGVFVRPVFLRRLDSWFDLIDFCNRLGHRFTNQASFLELRDRLLRFVPVKLSSLSCPPTDRFGQEMSSTAVVRRFDEATPRPCREDKRFLGWEGWTYRHYVPVVRKKAVREPSYLIEGLYHCDRTLSTHEKLRSALSGDALPDVFRRGQVPVKEIVKYKLTTSVAAQWI